ncbi:Ctr copper transporter [Xylaria bambusicola]|uniref:Ctr copper transporter n=1 Tax=Xylaria bambusicola TaxID=326684 RepID=UPI002008E570|nr:Ctr copper transporter [Xylaria bambusicola]KAI0509105.1 Ctr copper transporter [Xylaria bambusicola]
MHPNVEESIADGLKPHHHCRFSTLWNGYIIDSCFFMKSWHIHSIGAFVGFCVGVTVVAIFYELAQLLCRLYDRRLRHEARVKERAEGIEMANLPGAANVNNNDNNNNNNQASPFLKDVFRPTVVQQCIRVLLYSHQITLEYCLILLAMYYNVYVTTAIIHGRMIGFYIFRSERAEYNILRILMWLFGETYLGSCLDWYPSSPELLADQS